MSNQIEKVIRVGSRKSELALIQTKHVIGRLQKLYPTKKFEIHTMSTIGDRVLNISLPKIGEKSLFTRDLEDALRNGGVDFVVHSLKDLPTALPTGMAVGAVLEREDARDALVLRENYKDYTMETLPKGSIIGTSSLRRTAQIRRQYPHLVVCDIRGNLNTRLAKLDAPESKFSGIILAQAGLVRMGWMQRISQILEPMDLLYAVGQGALAVECRANDTEILDMLQKLMCLSTTCRILAERSFLKTLGGGCSAPVAVWSNLNGILNSTYSNASEIDLDLIGAVWSLDGAVEIRDKLSCTLKAQTKTKRPAPTTASALQGSSSSDESLSPPAKRQRHDNDDDRSNKSNSSSPKRSSPLVINDDAEVEQLTANFNVEELIEKHIDLTKTNEVGGGDADTDANSNIPHCPLTFDVGQDVMGRCPFVDNNMKITFASSKLQKESTVDCDNGNCTGGGDVTDHAVTSTNSKCPFSALHNELEINKNTNNSCATGFAKCPFLQKTVQMFDYADEEKPLPNKLSALIEDVDNLFCGLYQHACYSRELYDRCNNLGQKLAEELIKKGALDVMKSAQAEVHNKAT